MIFRDSIHIAAAPGQVFQFFEEADRHYLAWHPDHVLFRWVSGRGMQTGVVFYFQERIAGTLLTKTVRLTRIDRNRHIVRRFP